MHEGARPQQANIAAYKEQRLVANQIYVSLAILDSLENGQSGRQPGSVCRVNDTYITIIPGGVVMKILVVVICKSNIPLRTAPEYLPWGPCLRECT